MPPQSISVCILSWTLSTFLLMGKNKHVFNLHYKLNIYYYKLQKTEESFGKSNLPCHMYHLFQISFQKSILLQDRYATKSLDQLEIFRKKSRLLYIFLLQHNPSYEKIQIFHVLPWIDSHPISQSIPICKITLTSILIYS